jgi:hypothetical protein
MQIRTFCTTGDIHNNNLQGGGAQFNDSIKYYMQGIFMFKLLTVTKQRMNIVVALHGKTCFVIARPFFLSVLI